MYRVAQDRQKRVRVECLMTSLPPAVAAACDEDVGVLLCCMGCKLPKGIQHEAAGRTREEESCIAVDVKNQVCEAFLDVSTVIAEGLSFCVRHLVRRSRRERVLIFFFLSLQWLRRRFFFVVNGELVVVPASCGALAEDSHLDSRLCRMVAVVLRPRDFSDAAAFVTSIWLRVVDDLVVLHLLKQVHVRDCCALRNEEPGFRPSDVSCVLSRIFYVRVIGGEVHLWRAEVERASHLYGLECGARLEELDFTEKARDVFFSQFAFAAPFVQNLVKVVDVIVGLDERQFVNREKI